MISQNQNTSAGLPILQIAFDTENMSSPYSLDGG